MSDTTPRRPAPARVGDGQRAREDDLVRAVLASFPSGSASLLQGVGLAVRGVAGARAGRLPTLGPGQLVRSPLRG